jgi:6-phosphogluconolactonase
VSDAAATVQVADDPAALAELAARSAARALGAAVDAHGDATWVLAGGGTPLAAYRLLATRLKDAVPWARLRVLMGDERLVPIDHPDSNWGQTVAALLEHVPIPPEHLLRPPVELPGPEAAAAYERTLRALPATRAGWPRLDLVWIGMGEDGHCLSLFPDRPEVDVTDRLVVDVHDTPKPPPDRLSLTLPALRGAGCAAILAAGAGKAEPVARALAGDQSLPVTRAASEVTQAGGTLTWLLDRAASRSSWIRPRADAAAGENRGAVCSDNQA